MICDNCGIPLTVDQIPAKDNCRKLKYCSEMCRRSINHTIQFKKEVKQFIQNNDSRLGRYTVKSLRKAGFVVIVKEKEIEDTPQQ